MPSFNRLLISNDYIENMRKIKKGLSAGLIMLTSWDHLLLKDDYYGHAS